MATHTSLPNEKLSPWYFATCHAARALKQRIALAEEKAWPCDYDKHQLETLLELEQFLDSSWDAWVNSQADQLKQHYAVLNGWREMCRSFAAKQ